VLRPAEFTPYKIFIKYQLVNISPCVRIDLLEVVLSFFIFVFYIVTRCSVGMFARATL